MKEKLIAALLLCSIILSPAMLAACGQKTDDAAVTSGVSEETAETTTAETTTEGDVPEITEADYDGAVFNVLYPNWSLYNNYYFADENNGEAVNDAIFERTSKLEESLNVDFQAVTKGYIETIYPEINKTVMAGLDTYQLALTHCATSLVSYVTSACVLNFNDIPNIDMTKDYWNQSLASNMQIGGVLPFAANSFILPDVNTIFYNFQLIENYELETPYDLVESGDWTWDKLIEMSAAASADIDGDGAFTDADQYGFVGEMGWQFGSVLTSCDQYIVAAGDDGAEIVVNSEKTVNILDKIKTFLHSGNGAFTWTYTSAYDPNQGGTPPVSFDAGHAMFYLVPLSLASNFRSNEVDFGIIPLPKYDAAQQDYVTLNWSGFMCVPLTVADPEMVGAVIELLGYYNEKYVNPAFYDVLLGQKVSRDERSIEMLDIIFKGSVYDLGVNLGLYGITSSCVEKATSTEFSSYYEKNIKSWTKTVTDYSDAHIEYAENHG